MSFVFTERVVNIIPAHRVYSEEFLSDSLEQVAPPGTSRKLTRKTKVLNPIIATKTSSNTRKKTPTKELSKDHVKEHDNSRNVKISNQKNYSSINTKEQVKLLKRSHVSGVKESSKLGIVRHDIIMSSKPDEHKILGIEEEIIHSKLLAQKEKEKSLMIQKYIIEGKKKRLAFVKEERERKEAQRLELQQKLNALNDYRRSKFKVSSPQKLKESLEFEKHLNNQVVTSGSSVLDSTKITLDQKVDKVEHDVSLLTDYKDSVIERVSNISRDSVSTSTGLDLSTDRTDSTNKRVYKTLMVNIEMIKERIEQLANQSSSVSSITETVDSSSVKVADICMLNTPKVELLPNMDQEVLDGDILDEPHISFLIKEVEKKTETEVMEHSNYKNVVDEKLTEEYVAGDVLSDKVWLETNRVSNAITDVGIGSAETQVIETNNGDPSWCEDLNDSVILSNCVDSKDLADESIFVEDETSILPKDVFDKDSEQIGVGSLANFTRKVKSSMEEKPWIDPNDDKSDHPTDDYDATIFNILAKKLLFQTSGKDKEGMKYPNDSETAREYLKDKKSLVSAAAPVETEKIQLSRKRRISATDSSFEVLPKKSNSGESEQLRVLDIFQKKFIAKRHIRQVSSESVQPVLLKEAIDPAKNSDEIISQKKSNDNQITPDILGPPFSASEEPRVESSLIADSTSSGYESEDISKLSLKKYFDFVDRNRKPESQITAEKLKSKTYDEPASSGSANSSFSEKTTKGQIGSTWRQDSKKRLMDPRYKLSPTSLVEKYDAEMSLSEVIDLSLCQVDSMVQGRRIAIAQEEALNLRNIIQQKTIKEEDNTKSVINQKEADEKLKNYDYNTSFDSISTDSNIKEVGSVLQSSVSSDYHSDQNKASLNIGSFARPLMSESTKFRILSSADLMEKSIKEVLDYKDQAKLYFQQEFVWLNMRERAIDFRYAKEQSFYEHERKRVRKKDKERERLLIENVQALEMKLVADKEDINRQRERIRDKLEDVDSVSSSISFKRKRVESVLGKLSSAAVLEKSKKGYKSVADANDEMINDPYDREDFISEKVNSILEISETITSNPKERAHPNMSDPAKLELVQSALAFGGSMKGKFSNKNHNRKEITPDEIEEDIEGSQSNTSGVLNYENDDFEAISEISNNLKTSKASILEILMASPITAEVLEAAEKIKKLNDENEKRKQWLAENMKKQEFRLKEESKILGRAVDDFSRYIKETSCSNEALKSALHAVNKENKIVASVDSSKAQSVNEDRAHNISDIDENILANYSQDISINEVSADDVSMSKVYSDTKPLNEDTLPSNIHNTKQIEFENSQILPDNTVVGQPLDTDKMEEYIEDFESIEEIIEEMVQESDYNQELMDEEILQKVSAVPSANKYEEISQEESKNGIENIEPTFSQVDLITDAIWAALLCEIGDSVNLISNHIPSTRNVNASASKHQSHVANISLPVDVWKLSDEIPIELVNEIIMKILNISLSPLQNYSDAITLNQDIMDSIIPLQASNRRREECEILYDLTADSLRYVFVDHIEYHKKVAQGTSHLFLRPKSLTKDLISKKALEYCISCWSYSHQNGENLDSLLIKEVKDEERTWKQLEKSISLDLKEKISLKILDDLINDTTRSIYQLYKDVF